MGYNNTTKKSMHEVRWIRGNLKPISLLITFDRCDEHEVMYPHYNVLVVQAIIARNSLSRVMVDNGSFTILFESIFHQMQVNNPCLPMFEHIYGFIRKSLIQGDKSH